MRVIAFGLLCLAACTEHGQGGGPGPDGRPPLPAECVGRCIVEAPIGSVEDCCDTTMCFFDEETNEWRLLFCDLPPPDPCEQCHVGNQLCLQLFDGTCGLVATTCVERTAECPDNTCSAECEAAFCSSPFQCQNSVPCGTESPDAFACHGP